MCNKAFKYYNRIALDDKLLLLIDYLSIFLVETDTYLKYVCVVSWKRMMTFVGLNATTRHLIFHQHLNTYWHWHEEFKPVVPVWYVKRNEKGKKFAT